MQHCNMGVTYTLMWVGAPNGDPVIDVRVSSQNKAFVTGKNHHALTSHEACAWSETMRSAQTREASIENGMSATTDISLHDVGLCATAISSHALPPTCSALCSSTVQPAKHAL